MKNKFYITTSIAYTNAPPHIGHTLELLQADVLARYHRRLGDETWFLTGTDEHGVSVARNASKNNLGPEKFTDLISGKFRELAIILGVSNDDFIRTTDQIRHWPTVIKIWNKLLENGDLYKKKYKGRYCIGHEAFLKQNELVDNLCPLHKTVPKEIEEENWFFKLTKYKNQIKKSIENDELKILPVTRKSEIINLLNDAEDVSFSRPVKSLKWGIPVPNDPDQTIYVWADALSNYISAIGYADNSPEFNKFWPADIHLIGKDILRFHAMIWPGMLLSAGLALPKSIYVHGFITMDGQKMSKTIGNVVDPFAIIKKYGVEPIRYFLLREIPSNEDGNFSENKLVERYNGDLANNLGNLVSRVVKLIETKLNGELIFEQKFLDLEVDKKIAKIKQDYIREIGDFRLHEALAKVFSLLSFANSYIDDKKPWADHEADHILKILTSATTLIIYSASLLYPFLPETAEKIYKIFQTDPSTEKWEGHHFQIASSEPLFPRLK